MASIQWHIHEHELDPELRVNLSRKYFLHSLLHGVILSLAIYQRCSIAKCKNKCVCPFPWNIIINEHLLANVVALIYAGLGFGAILTQTHHMTASTIIAGERRSSSFPCALSNDALLPEASQLNCEVGVAVAEQAIVEGTARVD
ncbi:hypothetical protein H2248_001616 [Termitomyces sp. 'cryptogamus']|nr:hypothetical protein H2248_001616 [Termitomyces sp. 'cryptogamus']